MPGPQNHFSSPHRLTEVSDVCAASSSLMWAWGLELRSYTCIACALLTEPSPSPWLLCNDLEKEIDNRKIRVDSRFPLTLGVSSFGILTSLCKSCGFGFVPFTGQ